MSETITHEHQWISVEDRLPDKGETVWMATTDPDARWPVFLGKWDPWQSGTTHWMPVTYPLPPKPKRHKNMATQTKEETAEKLEKAVELINSLDLSELEDLYRQSLPAIRFLKEDMQTGLEGLGELLDAIKAFRAAWVKVETFVVESGLFDSEEA